MSIRLLSCLALALPAAALADPPTATTVEVKAEPGDSRWRERPSRTPESLPGFAAPTAPIETTRWGGWKALRLGEGTGFFRVHRAASGRWWLVDPDGHAFIHVGLAGVYRGRSEIAAATTAAKFSDTAGWAGDALRLLRENGFNGMGGWTEREAFAGRGDLLPYTVSFDVLAAFGRKLDIAHLNPGQTGYVNEVPPVLHPDFPDWADAYFAKRLPALKDDPFLIGWFSDNEIPFRRETLDRSLALDPARPELAPLRQAALDWLARRRGPDAKPGAPTTEEERIAFLADLCEHYYATVAAALRRHDPNHLYLGTRLHGRITRQAEVLRAAGRHVDVLSVNYYHAWSADPERVALWTGESGRPVLVTEFYAKGMDTGMENKNGAGWVVKTQEDRGRFYQNFAISLLETGGVVGWHWFKYRDNEPHDSSAMEGNQDSNKGVLAWDYAPYAPLLERMRALNAAVYPLCDYFDRRR